MRHSNVMITGASGGIGQATAECFAEEGCNLVLHYHRGSAAAETLARRLPGKPLLLQCDLRDEGQTRRMFREARSAMTRIDILVVNAGVWTPQAKPLADLSLRQWQDTLSVDLTGAFLICREFMEHLRAQPREEAAVVLIGSTAALFGEAGHADYAAAKAGLVHGLTATLKNEIVTLAPRGRVNCVCPGWTDTPMAAGHIGDEEAVRRATATMALQKVAAPRDVAHAVVFLSSPRLAGHISGAVLPVSGGMEGRLLHAAGSSGAENAG